MSKLSASRVRMEVRQVVTLIEEVRRERIGGEGMKNTIIERQYDKGYLAALLDLKAKLKREVGE